MLLYYCIKSNYYYCTIVLLYKFPHPVPSRAAHPAVRPLLKRDRPRHRHDRSPKAPPPEAKTRLHQPDTSSSTFSRVHTTGLRLHHSRPYLQQRFRSPRLHYGTGKGPGLPEGPHHHKADHRPFYTGLQSQIMLLYYCTIV